MGAGVAALAIERLDDLRATLVPPHFWRGDPLAILQGEGVRKVGIDVGLRFIIVGMIRRLLIAARARPKSFDSELVQHVLMVLGCGPVQGLRHSARCLLAEDDGNR